jgi:hypothetical protein
MARKPIEEYTDPKALKTIMENAKRLGDETIYRRAFRRRCALEGVDQTDPLHRAFYEALTALELLLSNKNGRTTKAARTRQKLRNKGVVQCIEDWAVSTAPTEGFKLLVDNGFAELTAEYIVLKFPARFSSTALATAKSRLTGFGVDGMAVSSGDP